MACIFAKPPQTLRRFSGNSFKNESHPIVFFASITTKAMMFIFQ